MKEKKADKKVSGKRIKEKDINRAGMLEQYQIQYERARQFSTPDVCVKILTEIGKLMKVDREVKESQIMIFNEDIPKMSKEQLAEYADEEQNEED